MDFDARSCAVLAQLCNMHCAMYETQRLLGHESTRTQLTPKLMHMPHNSAQCVDITVAAAEAAASASSCAVSTLPKTHVSQVMHN